MAEETALNHFGKRAKLYNQSSNWVSDQKLTKLMFDKSGAHQDSHVLDLATGTGLVAKDFLGKVSKLTGIDLTREMAEQNSYTDELVICSAYEMPFTDGSFDICICRQGLQFMDLNKALKEVARVLKKGGKVTFAHLTSYDQRDAEETFEIQRLRNPSRTNFLKVDDLPDALKEHNFKILEIINYETEESVEKWINIGALSEERMESIRHAYKKSSGDFKTLHKVSFRDGDIFDSMNMQVIVAERN